MSKTKGRVADKTASNIRKTKRVIETVLRTWFPTDTVDVAYGGYGDPTSLEVLVVSREFDNMDSTESHNFLRKIIDKLGFSSQERGRIVYIRGLSPRDCK